MDDQSHLHTLPKQGMKLNKHISLICLIIGLISAAIAFDGQPIYQKMYDLQGNRDVAYSGKIYPGLENAFIVVGVSTTPPGPGSTGLEFFALMVDTESGNRTSSFGIDGFTKIDFGNVGGTSRTDVATEVVFLTNPHRIAVLGESVVSKTGSVNLSFAIAMIDSEGNPVSSFGNNGLGLYDIETGANDEIFFGHVDDDNNIIAGGFANPTPAVGAGPAFNCAVLKVNQFGARDVNWGTNGQLIIDFSGWDERCRASLPLRDVTSGEWTKYMVGGRSKPAPGYNMSATPPVLYPPTADQTNFRATMTSIDYNVGQFTASYGGNETALNASYVGIEFGPGRSAINTYNGSFDTIKIIESDPSLGDATDIISLGNWGGWDYGVSGNKAIALIRWKPDGERDPTWGNDGITSITPYPSGGQSFDVYSLKAHYDKIYVVGGVKATAGSVSPPRSIIARFLLSTGAVDLDFYDNGVYVTPQIDGSTSSLYKSLVIEDDMMYISGEVGVYPGTSADVNVLIAKYNLTGDRPIAPVQIDNPVAAPVFAQPSPVEKPAPVPNVEPTSVPSVEPESHPVPSTSPPPTASPDEPTSSSDGSAKLHLATLTLVTLASFALCF